MFVMYAVRISLFQSICVVIAMGEWKCSNMPNCRCYFGGIHETRTLSCNNITVDQLLNLENRSNIESLVISDSNFGEISPHESRTTLKIAVRQVYIKRTSITTFSWKWMPKSLTKLTISSTKIKSFHTEHIPHLNGEYEQRCGMDHLKVMKILAITDWGMNTIPECIPASVQTLIIYSVNLADEAKVTDTTQRWPESLTLLQFRNNSISEISRNFFAGLPRNLTKLNIRDQPRILDTKFLVYIPVTKLINLALQNISITDIPESHLANLSREEALESLSIQLTLLVRVPNKLPKSVMTLRMNNNRITELDGNALAPLTRLKTLDLSRNLIQTVSAQLPESLEELYLSHNNILTMSAEIFTRLTKLKILFMPENRLETMPQGIQPGLRQYRIDGNSLTDIGPPINYEFCASCTLFSIERNPWNCNENMVKFLLWNNDNRNNSQVAALEGSAICKDGFTGLYGETLNKVMKKVVMFDNLGCDYNITHVTCVDNSMEKMPELTPELQDVRIIDNEKMGSVPNYTFVAVTRLKRLQLQNIGLQEIPTGLPETIVYLNLAFNEITGFSPEVQRTIQRLRGLRYFDIQHNKLHTFPVTMVQTLGNLQWIHLKGNPLTCTCSLWPLVIWVNNRTKVSVRKKEVEGFFGECTLPLSKKGTDIRLLSEYFKHEKVCLPPNCGWDGTSALINCSYAMQDQLGATSLGVRKIPTIPSNDYWKTIDLSSLRLQIADINLTNLTDLETVILSNNSLNKMPIKGLPKSVKTIDLSYNNISKLPLRDKWQDQFNKLECIDLRHNNIRTISEEEVSIFQRLLSLKLEGNPLICDCKIRPLASWITANHDIPTKKQHDFQDLICRGPDKLIGKPIAKLTDADYCPGTRISVVVGGLVGGVMLLLIIFCFSLGYYRKRGKIKEREAILQGFRDLLQQEADYKEADPEMDMEENARIKYDAFLSYSPNDEDAEFAAMLSEELEMKYSYKLCIHERDFLPGMGIADNIVECIGASKRIILILSNHFLMSPWCQYEVQIALTELHHKRKSKLLIPILLEDIDENIEGSVKTFLSLIKAIKIPDGDNDTSWEAFWKGVLRAMPDQRILDMG